MQDGGYAISASGNFWGNFQLKHPRCWTQRAVFETHWIHSIGWTYYRIASSVHWKKLTAGECQVGRPPQKPLLKHNLRFPPSKRRTVNNSRMHSWTDILRYLHAQAKLRVGPDFNKNSPRKQRTRASVGISHLPPLLKTRHEHIWRHSRVSSHVGLHGPDILNERFHFIQKCQNTKISIVIVFNFI